SIIVVVQGEEDRIKAYAEAVVPKIKEVIDPKDGKPYVKRVDYKLETDFIKEHGLMLIKADDLKNMKDVFKRANLVPLLTNINNSFEKEYVGREESISTREKEDGAVAFLDGIENLVKVMRKSVSTESVSGDDAQKAVDRLLFGEPYILSYDKKALILNVVPNFTMMETDKMVSGTDAIQGVIDTVLLDYPDVKAGLTGMIPVGHDEMVYSQKSLGYTTIIAFVAILILLIVSFRMWVAPVLALLSLVVGIIWAVGTATILVGTLNIMTSMMAVILIGLGIDFSIHIISTFTEGRALRKPIGVAMEETFLKSGMGILTGGLTTCVAFFTMVISSSRGMREMGLVTSGGLLAILIATFLFLPSLLALRERRLEKKREKGQLKGEIVHKDISFKSLGAIGSFLSKRYIATIIASIIVTILLILSASRMTFDQNYMNMEPKGLTSIELQDTVLDKFDFSMDYALILADSVDESGFMAEKAKEMPSVAMTEDISLYLPSKEQQERRIPFINEINEAIRNSTPNDLFEINDFEKLLEELNRLDMNIIEMQDMAFIGGQDKVDNKCAEIVGKPDDDEPKDIILELIQVIKNDRNMAIAGLRKFQKEFAPYFKESVIRMSSTEMIQLRELPVSILDRYANRDRTQFLVTVFPTGNIWQNMEFLARFTDDLEKISDRATGMPPVFRALIDIIGRDGRNAALLAILIMFLLLWLDYGKPGYALIAMIPLTVGVFWMVGLMRLVGMQLTVVNVMGLPMILGIGIDDGVHVVHRWRIEGRGKISRVFASTGKAILLTSVTTMLAFGSLVFSVWRGFASLGGAMFIGVGACFIATVIILSGIIGLLERRSGK
ncbi:MAG: RND family transporter, partial [Candidatus Poribacteria bacterium]